MGGARLALSALHAAFAECYERSGPKHKGHVIDEKPLVAYKLHMATPKHTDEFNTSLKGLRDIKAKAKVIVRAERLGLGTRVM
jgi:hypothetical protein